MYTYQINEAFGSMYVYCVETLGLDINKVNVNGGAMCVIQYYKVGSGSLRYSNLALSVTHWVLLECDK